jgi:protein kinase-like protein
MGGAQQALPEVGQVFGGFLLERVLGQGAMGRVYSAQSPSGQRVALKVLLESPEDEEASQRFVREGLAMAAVPPHPNVLGVVTAGQDCGLLFLALELATGGDLENELQSSGRLEPETALDVAEALAAALDHIHEAGIVHRDLKPANAIRREDGTLALADFGLAKVNSLERLTQTGEMLGTPLYMAPEQVMGEKDLDGRADVWALGVILYRALSGHLPFQGATATQTMQLILDEEPAPLSAHRPELGAGYQELITRSLGKEREDRYQTGAEFREAIRGCRERSGRQSEAHLEAKLKRVLLGLSAIAVLLLLATGGLIYVTRERARAEFTLRLKKARAQSRTLAGDLLARGAPPQSAALAEFTETLAALEADWEKHGESGVHLEELRLAARRARWRDALERKAWASAEEIAAGSDLPSGQKILMGQVLRLARGEALQDEVLEELVQSQDQEEAGRGARILLAGRVAEADLTRARDLLRDLHQDPLAAPERRWIETLAATESFELAPLLGHGPELSEARRATARRRVIALLEPLIVPVENQEEVLDLSLEERTPWDHARATALLRALAALRPSGTDGMTPPLPRESKALRALLVRIEQSIQARDDIKNIEGWRAFLSALGKAGLRADQRTRAPVLMPFVIENRDVLPIEAMIEYGLTLFRLDIPVDTAELSPRSGPIRTIEDLAPGTATPLAEFVTLRLRLLKGNGPKGVTLARLVQLLRETPEVVGPYCRADALGFLAAAISLPLEDRVAYAEAARALDPKSPWIRVSRALCLAEQGREEEARREEQAALEAHVAEQVLQSDPDSFFARRGGLTYAALGDLSKANERFTGIKFPSLSPRVQSEAETLYDRCGRALRKKREKR